jgi:hypothetical protein
MMHAVQTCLAAAAASRRLSTPQVISCEQSVVRREGTGYDVIVSGISLLVIPASSMASLGFGFL